MPLAVRISRYGCTCLRALKKLELLSAIAYRNLKNFSQ